MADLPKIFRVHARFAREIRVHMPNIRVQEQLELFHPRARPDENVPTACTSSCLGTALKRYFRAILGILRVKYSKISAYRAVLWYHINMILSEFQTTNLKFSALRAISVLMEDHLVYRYTCLWKKCRKSREKIRFLWGGGRGRNKEFWPKYIPLVKT